MRRRLVAIAALALTILAACSAPGPSPASTLTSTPESSAVAIGSREAAAQAARVNASIRGPVDVGGVELGRYRDLWMGSGSDLSGAPQPADDLIIWRVDLTGPTGREQVYLDAGSGAVVDRIVQGQ